MDSCVFNGYEETLATQTRGANGLGPARMGPARACTQTRGIPRPVPKLGACPDLGIKAHGLGLGVVSQLTVDMQLLTGVCTAIDRRSSVCRQEDQQRIRSSQSVDRPLRAIDSWGILAFF